MNQNEGFKESTLQAQLRGQNESLDHVCDSSIAFHDLTNCSFLSRLTVVILIVYGHVQPRAHGVRNTRTNGEETRRSE